MSKHAVRVAADTALGVVFTDLKSTGSGVLITDRLVEKVAEAHRLRPDEVTELVSVTLDGKPVNLPPPPHWRAA